MVLKSYADDEQPEEAAEDTTAMQNVLCLAQWCTAVAMPLIGSEACLDRASDLLCCLKCCLAVPHTERNSEHTASLQAMLCTLYALLPATTFSFLCFESLNSTDFLQQLTPYLRGLPLHPALLCQPVGDVIEMLQKQEEHTKQAHKSEWVQWSSPLSLQQHVSQHLKHLCSKSPKQP